MPKTLRGGTFNLKYGRDPKRVHAETRRLGEKHALDFLNVQEFSDYLAFFEDSDYWEPFPKRGRENLGAESGILVRRGVAVSRVSQHVYGDGWTTTRGGHFPAAVHTELLIAGWLWDRSVHLPTPTEWIDGRVKAPTERLDDLEATMLGLSDYLDHPAVVHARLLAGDFNEPPTTTGKFTPRWLANAHDADLQAPTSREGHGRIDYAIGKGCRIVDTFKDTVIPELSDHEPVIFKVVKGR